MSAFESGKFDQANELKQSLENFQRETRKKREQGELPPHKPRWFAKTIDPDSKDTLWQPLTIRETGQKSVDPTAYWAERREVRHRKLEGEKADWTDVYHIFGDFEVQ